MFIALFQIVSWGILHLILSFDVIFYKASIDLSNIDY